MGVCERLPDGRAAPGRHNDSYDAFDRRTGKQLDADANGTVDRKTAWVWDGQQVVMQLVDADGAGAGAWKLTNRYLYGDAVDLVLADEQLPSGGIGLTSVSYTTGNVLWPLFDQLGSVRDVVDSNGVIRQHLVFDSFGNRLSETDYNTSGVVIPNNDPAAVDELFGYTGREWDSDVKLQYNRARWYDQAQGRWISQDPIGFAAGDVNLYRYVGNSPVFHTDPSGLDWLDGAANFSAGIGDSMSLGLGWLIRDKLIGINTVDYDSGGYYWGGWGGVAVDVCTGGATAIVKGGAKTGGKVLAKEAAEEVAEQLAKEAAERAAREAAKRAAQAAAEAAAKNVPVKTAFEIAQEGGKHAGFLKNYLGKPASQLQKGIKSLEKEIADHLDKIANPKKHIPNWDCLDPRQQQALINSKWPGDIARQREQLEILQGLLRSLGGGS